MSKQKQRRKQSRYTPLSELDERNYYVPQPQKQSRIDRAVNITWVILPCLIAGLLCYLTLSN